MSELWLLCAVFIGCGMFTIEGENVAVYKTIENPSANYAETLRRSRNVRPTGRPTQWNKITEREADTLAGSRSLHLWWDMSASGPVTEAVADVVVEASASESYFCNLGFGGGYMGIQERPQDKVFIYSLWDAGSEKVKVIESGPGVMTKRFGGEGEGYQSFLFYNWQIGEVCSCKILATRSGSATRYTGFAKGSDGKWMHIATYEVEDGGRFIEGLYSFVEDYGGRTSAQDAPLHRAKYAMHTKSPGQRPMKILQATLTADTRPQAMNVTNINAGVEGPWLFLASGSDTHQDVPLDTKLTVE